MAKPLRQVIELPIGDDVVPIDVTFRILEVIERHYDLRAEIVGKLVLENDSRIKRTDIARVILGWADAARLDVDREALYESVMTSNDATLRKYVGAIQGALWYSLKEISADEMKKLAAGENIRQPDPEDDDDDEDGGKKKSGATE